MCSVRVKLVSSVFTSLSCTPFLYSLKQCLSKCLQIIMKLLTLCLILFAAKGNRLFPLFSLGKELRGLKLKIKKKI